MTTRQRVIVVVVAKVASSLRWFREHNDGVLHPSDRSRKRMIEEAMSSLKDRELIAELDRMESSRGAWKLLMSEIGRELDVSGFPEWQE